MQFSGEQYVPGITKKRLVDEHEARYAFACKFASGKKTLDIACGTGYGSYELSQTALDVTGVDLSEESIVFARSNFNRPNLTFIKSSACEPLFAPSSFDLIVSFETIEHLEAADRQKYLENLRTWLKPEGVLLLSTPNKRVTSPWNLKPLNKFHVLEFTRLALENELAPYFKIEKILGQRVVPKIYTYFVVRKFLRVLEKIFGFKNEIYDLGNGPEINEFGTGLEPKIFVCVCRSKKDIEPTIPS